MLVGLSGFLSGYNGSFPFSKPGDEYSDDFYVPIRLVSTLPNLYVAIEMFVNFSVLNVLSCFIICRNTLCVFLFPVLCLAWNSTHPVDILYCVGIDPFIVCCSVLDSPSSLW